MAVHLLQVVIGAGATQISAPSIPVRQVTFQNNNAHVCRLGDSSVSASKGIQLANGAPGGAATLGTQSSYNTDLSDWFVFGTATDVIDVLYIT